MDELFLKSLHYIESTLTFYETTNFNGENDKVIQELQDICNFMNTRFEDYVDMLSEVTKC